MTIYSLERYQLRLETYKILVCEDSVPSIVCLLNVVTFVSSWKILFLVCSEFNLSFYLTPNTCLYTMKDSLKLNSHSGTVPTEIGKLIQLKQLRLERNALTGTMPSEIGELVSLEDLRLYNNSLMGPLPLELGNLANLSESIPPPPHKRDIQYLVYSCMNSCHSNWQIS